MQKKNEKITLYPSTERRRKTRAELASKMVHCADFVHNPPIITTTTQNHGDGWPKNAARAQNCGINGDRNYVIFTPLRMTHRSLKSVHPCVLWALRKDRKRFNSILAIRRRIDMPFGHCRIQHNSLYYGRSRDNSTLADSNV